MKKQIHLFCSLFFASLSAVFAQGAYDVRLVHDSFDCVNNKAVACVEIKAASADSAFKLDGANIRIIYSTSQVTSPRFKTINNFSGGFYDKMDSVSVLNPSGTQGMFTINIVNAVSASNGTVVGANWMKIACLEFDIPVSNITKCYQLTLSKTSPATSVVTKIISAGNAVVASQGTFSSIAQQCPVEIVVRISSTSPQNLTFTATSGDLPAKVTLTNGTIIQMTQAVTSFAISPTAKTTYTIQSVSNNCGVGRAATGTDFITIDPAPVDVCADTQMCPVITAVKRTL